MQPCLPWAKSLSICLWFSASFIVFLTLCNNCWRLLPGFSFMTSRTSTLGRKAQFTKDSSSGALALQHIVCKGQKRSVSSIIEKLASSRREMSEMVGSAHHLNAADIVLQCLLAWLAQITSSNRLWQLVPASSVAKSRETHGSSEASSSEGK